MSISANPSVLSTQGEHPSPESTPAPRGSAASFSNRALWWAFWIQLTIVALCSVATIWIYRNYSTKLQAEIALQQSLRDQIAENKEEISAIQTELKTSILNQAQLAMRNKDYPYSAAIANDGLKLEKNDPYLTWILVKALLLQGNKQGALKTASELPLTGISQNHLHQNLLTLGVAKCFAGDSEGAIQAINDSTVAKSYRADIDRFCSTKVRSELH